MLILTIVFFFLKLSKMEQPPSAKLLRHIKTENDLGEYEDDLEDRFSLHRIHFKAKKELDGREDDDNKDGEKDDYSRTEDKSKVLVSALRRTASTGESDQSAKSASEVGPGGEEGEERTSEMSPSNKVGLQKKKKKSTLSTIKTESKIDSAFCVVLHKQSTQS